MSHPLVSILVPVYNVEPYIERCARSLFEQTYDNLEYIFVDDCTPDKSMQIIEEVIKDYPYRAGQVRIIKHEYNKGIGVARNILVENAQGEFVWYVDSDDWVEVNSIELMVYKAQETNADIITCNAYAHYVDKVIEYVSGGWDLDRDILLEMILKRKRSTTLWYRLIRKCLFDEYHLRFDDKIILGEDLLLFPQLLYYAQKVAGIPDYLYHYNKNNSCSIIHRLPSQLDLQINGSLNKQSLKCFFREKNTYYYCLCEILEIKYFHKCLKWNYVERNKKGYTFFANKLKETNPIRWGCIEWNRPVIRLLESNYYLYYVLSSLRIIKRKGLMLIGIVKNNHA